MRRVGSELLKNGEKRRGTGNREDSESHLKHLPSGPIKHPKIEMEEDLRKITEGLG